MKDSAVFTKPKCSSTFAGHIEKIMPFQYYTLPTQRIENQLPDVSKFIEWSLWIKPYNFTFSSGDLLTMKRAFAPLKGVLWQATSSSAKSIHTPFERCPKAVAETIMEGFSMYPALKRIVDYKVAWAAEGDDEAVAKLLGSGHYPHSNLNLAFLPKDQFIAIKWANIIQGPLWLWLCDEWRANSIQPALAASGVTLSYLRLTLEIGGIPSLIWVDCDMEVGLTFFGSKALMETTTTQLKELGAELNPHVFERFLNGYFSFDMSR